MSLILLFILGFSNGDISFLLFVVVFMTNSQNVNILKTAEYNTEREANWLNPQWHWFLNFFFSPLLYLQQISVDLIFLCREFNRIYREQFFEPLDVDRFGFSSCEAMLRALTQILTVKGFGIKKRIVLRNHMRRAYTLLVALLWICWLNNRLYVGGPLSHSLDFDPETHPDKPSCLFIDEQPYHLHHSQVRWLISIGFNFCFFIFIFAEIFWFKL